MRLRCGGNDYRPQVAGDGEYGLGIVQILFMSFLEGTTDRRTNKIYWIEACSQSAALLVIWRRSCCVR